MKKGLFIIALLFFTSATYGQDNYSYFNSGMQEFDKGRYRSAIVQFTKAIEFDQRITKEKTGLLASCYLFRGISKSNAEDYSGAILDLTTSITLIKNFFSRYEASPQEKEKMNALIAEAYFYRSASNSLKNNFNEGLLDIKEAFRINKKDDRFWMLSGMIKIKLGQKESGCLDFSRAGELGNAEAYKEIKLNCN